MLKLRKRKETTKFCTVCEVYNGKQGGEVRREFLKKGYFTEPYHFFIDTDGNIYDGREIDAIGASNLMFNEEHILVLIDAPSTRKINWEQQRALEGILCNIEEKYGCPKEIINCDGLEQMEV